MKKITESIFFAILLLVGPVYAAALVGNTKDTSTSNLKSLRPIIVHQTSTVLPVFNIALNERVAWVNVGDSNMLSNGVGWDQGLSKALKEKFGLWSTGLQPINGLDNNLDILWGHSGYISDQLSGSVSNTGAPAALASQFVNTIATPPYAFLSSGTANLVGMNYYGGNESHALQYHYTFGTDSGWNGSFRPSVRRAVAPFTELVAQPTSTPTIGTSGALVHGSLNVPAGTVTDGTKLQFRLSSNANDVNAQFFGVMQQVEDTSKQNGFSVQILGFWPGHTARDMAMKLTEFGTASLTEYFREVRSLLGPRKAVVFGIHEGMNDRADSNPSVGPVGGLNSSTKDGYKDNVKGIMNTIRAVYTANGWDKSQLYFVLYPSHPISLPDDYRLVWYREAAREIAATDPNVAAVSLDQLITYPQMLANNYYNGNNTDVKHLSEAGYNALAQLAVQALTTSVTQPTDQ